MFGILLVVIATVAYAASSVVVGNRAPDFGLKDQFGKSWTLSGLNGTVTVLVVANSDSGRAMGPWVDALKARYNGKVQILGLLDLHTVPGIGRGIAKSRIRNETKDPLMLDFNGGTGSAYGVTDKYPIVVVIDKTGVVRAVARTNYSQDAFSGIATVVDKSAS